MIISVEVTPQEALPEDEFWRDVEATNRCDEPKKAKQFLSSLITRRARWEAYQYSEQHRLTNSEIQSFIQTRSRELWVQCRSLGFPKLTILGITANVTVNLPDYNEL
jgi:hypothetical protein